MQSVVKRKLAYRFLAILLLELDPSKEIVEKLFDLSKKTKLLTLILVSSLGLNAAFLIIFFYFFIRENPIPITFTYQPYFSTPEKACTNHEMVARFETLPFEKLSPLLGDTHHIEEGITTRDLTLGILIDRDHLDIHRIFGKTLLPSRWLKINENKSLPIYSHLSDEDYKKISYFIVIEKWPFTFDRLFALVQEKGESVDPAYLQMFFQSEEAFTVERLFSRGPIPLQKKVLLSLLREGSYQILATFCKEQKERMDISENKRREFLLNYLHVGSKTAALLLVYTDMPYLIKQIDDKTALNLLRLLPEKSEKGALFAASLLNTLRSDIIKREATEYLSKDKEFAKRFTNRPSIGQLRPIFRDTPPASLSANQHIVQPGESLWSIAKKYNVPVETLIKLNNLTSTTLQSGKILKLS